MAKPFSSKEAKQIMSLHRTILSKLNSAKEMEENYSKAISSAADALIANEVLEILKAIPIDEISRYRRGFRVKTLKDNGYNTIFDVLSATENDLSSVNGISDDAAFVIKGIAKDIESKSKQGIKVKLSADNKSPNESKLVLAVSKYKACRPFVSECNELLEENEENISSALKNVSPASNGIKWLLTSSIKKQRAIDSYNYLLGVIDEEYWQKANAVTNAIKEIDNISDNVAWQDFSDNSIKFFNIIEEFNPEILGTDDTVYGLPEDLAQEVQEEDFFPDGLVCTLRRYQEWGVKYILHQQRVLLGDEMGLGKTIQAIAVMVSLRNTGATHFVVVCPASVMTNWCREIKKMSLLSVIKIHGNDKEKAFESWIKTGGVAVTTYETTACLNFEDNFKFSMLVVDEAHYIKNPEALRTANVKKISTHSERLLFMTGTALENNVNEMLQLIYILQPNIAIQANSMAFLSSAPQFREKIAPVYYRRKREDVLTELPELIDSKEWCSLLPEEEEIYERSILNKNYADARRVSWNVDDLNCSSKAKRMMEIVDEAESDGRKIIIFTFFLDTIRKVTSLLGDKCLDPINGSVTPQRRQEIIDEFDKAPSGAVLVAQIQSGGTGLNIQSASVVILCEPQFKPSIENQAISRAYRMGQTRNVLVYRLLCDDTVDEKIMERLENKQAIFDAFADESVAANESDELDDKTFGEIINEEIGRINAKRQSNGQDTVTNN